MLNIKLIIRVHSRPVGPKSIQSAMGGR